METFYDSDLENACRQAAAVLRRRADEQLRGQDRLVVGIPGGRSISPFLSALGAERFPFAQCTLLMTDERAVAAEDPNRNDVEILRLLDERGITHDCPGMQLLRPRIAEDALEASAEAYTAILRSLGLHFDILILGVGEDGHVASLFPDAAELSSTSAGYLAVRTSPKPPPQRISVSPRLVREASCVVLLAFGDGKRAARTALSRARSVQADLPASLALAAPTSILVTDLQIDGDTSREP